jgi:hypothetical protein
MFQRSERYEPRPVRFLELIERDGWRFKVYSIVYGPHPLDRAIYDDAIDRALRDLPRPAVTVHRPGVGFIICYQGCGWHYLVVSWWDNENELPQHIYVRPIDVTPGMQWRRAAGGESICVWDLQVIAAEREAYVKHVLSPADGPDLDAYLATLAGASGGR